MKKFNTKDVIKSIEYNIWIQALILNLIAFAISQFFFEPVFETNDDNYISAILYGVYGEYDTHLVYMNVIMGKIIKLLLLLCPILPWYTICLLYTSGVYLDTDVELIQPLDELLQYNAFMGFEGNYINLGLGFGARPGIPELKELMSCLLYTSMYIP